MKSMKIFCIDPPKAIKVLLRSVCKLFGAI